MRMHFTYGYKNLYATFFVRGFHESLLGIHVYTFILYLCKYCVGNIMQHTSGYKNFFFNDPNIYIDVLDRAYFKT